MAALACRRHWPLWPRHHHEMMRLIFSQKASRKAFDCLSANKWTLRHFSSEKSTSNEGSSLLEGIRVLDLTRVLAGPLCTQILGDMGAEIIKIEKPGSGDETRNWGPPFMGSESCYFLSVNRNKKSVAVDISQPEGAAIIQKIAEKSDVLMENFLPGKLHLYGLGYDELRQINPKLIYCSISGYGPDGPYKDRGGYDVIVSAIGGMMHITGPENGEPCKMGTAMTDISTGLYAHGAILAGLLRRQRTGKGTKIDCSLLSTQVANLVNLGTNFLNTKIEPKRWGTAHESIVPYQGFKTKDDQYIIVGAGSDQQFASLCRFMSLNYHQDDKFKSNKVRVANRAELISLLSCQFLKRPLGDWLDLFQSAKFPFGPVQTFAQVFADPQVQHNDLVSEMVHEKAGKIRLLKSPVKMIDCDLKARLPPPILGEHTDIVLRDILNFDDETILRLRESGVIQ